jgi:hypothetical protein
MTWPPITRYGGVGVKLPKLPSQWTRLTELEKSRIDEASGLCVEFLYHAGYKSPQELDENGEEIGDAVQSLLMDAALRSEKVRMHIEMCNLASVANAPLEQAEESDSDFDLGPTSAAQQWGPWGPDGRQGH